MVVTIGSFSVIIGRWRIKRGNIYGSSDAFAAMPEDDPLSVEDLVTTVYNQLGIVADKELMARVTDQWKS